MWLFTPLLNINLRAWRLTICDCLPVSFWTTTLEMAWLLAIEADKLFPPITVHSSWPLTIKEGLHKFDNLVLLLLQLCLLFLQTPHNLVLLLQNLLLMPIKEAGFEIHYGPGVPSFVPVAVVYRGFFIALQHIRHSGFVYSVKGLLPLTKPERYG